MTGAATAGAGDSTEDGDATDTTAFARGGRVAAFARAGRDGAVAGPASLVGAAGSGTSLVAIDFFVPRAARDFAAGAVGMAALEPVAAGVPAATLSGAGAAAAPAGVSGDFGWAERRGNVGT